MASNRHSSKGCYLFLLLAVVLCCHHVVSGSNSSTIFFDDPEVSTQEWIFQMINIYPVWEQGYTGSGIRVRVNDIGMDSANSEFDGRFDLNASCVLYEARYNNATREMDQHGTTVASILGAARNNSQCGTGIAPAVTISSCVVIGANPDQTSWDATILAYKHEQIDVSQNAYGFVHCPRSRQFSYPSDKFSETPFCPFTHFGETVVKGTTYDFYEHPCEACDFSAEEPSSSCNRAIRRHCLYHFLHDREVCLDLISGLTLGGQCLFLNQFENTTKSFEIGATEGRNGKGIVYVFSSGNDALGDTNFAGRYQSRYVIYVGSVGRDAIQTQYSRAGASLFITAPAGDIESNGTQPVAKVGGGCKDAGTGTSFSSATVSGVIALLLEANPDLAWRDVQGILATTSRPVTHTDIVDETEVVNGAGLFHSNSHGFGIIDALAAVTAAQNWESYGEEQHLTNSDLNLNLPIGDDPNSPTTAQFVIESPGGSSSRTIVENVVVSLYLEHLSRGHLMISLTSPSGTVSILAPGSRPENGQLLKDEPWMLRTVRSWGEEAEGTWKLSIADVEEGDVSNCIDYANFTAPALNTTFDCNFLEYFPAFYTDDFQELISQLFDQGAADGCCTCGGGTISEGSCVDNDGVAPLCKTTEILEACVNGTLTEEYAFFLRKDDDGRTARDACCVFGGGITIENTTSFEDQLTGWSIDIYGHVFEATPAPTLLDSHAPSSEPSSFPTDLPSALPSALPPSLPPTLPIAQPEPTGASVDSSSADPSPLHRGPTILSASISIFVSICYMNHYC